MAASGPKPTLQQLAKKHNIHFDGPPTYPFRCPEEWPASRGTIATHVQTLGREQWDQYRASVSCDALDRPWREQLEMQRRAEVTARVAQRCLDERRNEAEWRERIEARVLARLTVEVACTTCRGRLWRSKQEVDPGDVLADEAARRLQRRQSKRHACVCDRGGSWHPWDESGTSPLFDYNLEEAIEYPPEVQAVLSKRKAIPDRVYGLRLTRRLERILSCPNKRHSAADPESDQCIGDTIRSHPFKGDSEPARFPFLVLEAKSEKGSDSLSDAAYQTAFSIREMLSIQEELREAAGEGPDWRAGPLVWFLSNKGEDWKVCIAYIETANGRKNFRVVQLWRGAINDRENALRLLLIVDYIFDWARDLYRDAVIRSLMALSASDLGSLAYKDSDIFSFESRVNKWAAGGQSGKAIAIPKDALRSFDTRQGVIRDIRYVQTRFLGLCVTQSNLGAFLNATGSDLASRELAGRLLSLLEDGCRVKGDALSTLRSEWTGEYCERDMEHEETSFVVVATVVAYLTPDWQQTRELSYIAVEESVVDRLSNHAAWRWMDRDDSSLSNLPFVDKAVFSENIRTLHCQPAIETLVACISRASRATLSRFWGRFETDTHPASSQEAIIRTRTIFERDSKPDRRAFVRAMYNHWRYSDRGNQPFCPYLRVSSVMDVLDPLGDSSISTPATSSGGPFIPSATASHSQRRVVLDTAPSDFCALYCEPPGWFDFWERSKLPPVPDHGILVALSNNPVAGPTSARLCLFVMDPAAALKNASESEALLQSAPPWHFRARKYCDDLPGWCDGWNYNPTECLTWDERILHPLTAYTEALKAMEARPAQGQGTHYGIGGKTDQAWALKRSKSIWNAIWLCKPFLASVWDQEPVDLQSLYSVQAEPRPVTDSTKIQRGLRNNTPNSDAESGPKSKQRDIIRNGRVSHNCPPEGDNSACYASIRRSPRKATPGEQSYVPAANSGSSSLKRREPGGSPDAECSPLRPKRQCPEPDTSHDLALTLDCQLTRAEERLDTTSYEERNAHLDWLLDRFSDLELSGKKPGDRRLEHAYIRMLVHIMGLCNATFRPR